MNSKPINNTDEFFANLPRTLLNTLEHIKAQEEVNKTCEDSRRDFIIMSTMSEISAGKTIVWPSSIVGY